MECKWGLYKGVKNGEMGWCGVGAVQESSQNIYVNMLYLYKLNNTNNFSLGGKHGPLGGNIPWSPPLR